MSTSVTIRSSKVLPSPNEILHALQKFLDSLSKEILGRAYIFNAWDV